MAAESSSLLRWSETSLSRRTQTRTIVKVISKPVWNQGERVISTNTIPMAVETGSAQERPLSWHIKNEPSRRKAKTNTPTLSTRHWGTDYEAVHKTNHVPRTDNHSETTLRTFQLWSPRQGFFVVFTQPCLILALFQNLASCFHFAFLCSLHYVHFFICIFLYYVF